MYAALAVTTTAPLDPVTALRDAQRAYAAGDFAQLRALCAPEAFASSPELAAQAQALRARVSVDPVAIALLAACLLLFLGIVHAYVV